MLQPPSKSRFDRLRWLLAIWCLNFTFWLIPWPTSRDDAKKYIDAVLKDAEMHFARERALGPEKE